MYFTRPRPCVAAVSRRIWRRRRRDAAWHDDDDDVVGDSSVGLAQTRMTTCPLSCGASESPRVINGRCVRLGVLLRTYVRVCVCICIYVCLRSREVLFGSRSGIPSGMYFFSIFIFFILFFSRLIIPVYKGRSLSLG